MSKKQNTDSTEQPCMVKSHDIHIDAEYAEWIAELKHRYRYGRTVDSRQLLQRLSFPHNSVKI